MSQCEARQQNYLFRQRSTQGVVQLIQRLERQGRLANRSGTNGRDAAGELQLTDQDRWVRVTFRFVGTRGRAGSDPARSMNT